MACDKCGKQFPKKSGLKLHVSGVHEGLKRNRGKFKEICEICQVKEEEAINQARENLDPKPEFFN